MKILVRSANIEKSIALLRRGLGIEGRIVRLRVFRLHYPNQRHSLQKRMVRRSVKRFWKQLNQ